tara:strand:+ start:4520 stop:5218 length:699 start_codon:yes stop_codon:yes gene_type:complete
MPRLKNKNRIYFYFFCFVFLTTITNQKFILLIKNIFHINNIVIKIDKLNINEEKFIKFNSIINQNIFLIKKEDFFTYLNEINYLQDINIKKKYPSTIIFTAKKTNIVALTYLNQKKFYIGENGKFIPSDKIDFTNNLPTIFGKFEIQEFLWLRNVLKELDINYKNIKKYHFHKTKRWDLYFDNNIILKLPDKNIPNALKVYKKFKEKNDINENKTIDLRISNRLIMDHEEGV